MPAVGRRVQLAATRIRELEALFWDPDGRPYKALDVRAMRVTITELRDTGLGLLGDTERVVTLSHAIALLGNIQTLLEKPDV